MDYEKNRLAAQDAQDYTHDECESFTHVCGDKGQCETMEERARAYGVHATVYVFGYGRVGRCPYFILTQDAARDREHQTSARDEIWCKGGCCR